MQITSLDQIEKDSFILYYGETCKVIDNTGFILTVLTKRNKKDKINLAQFNQKGRLI